MSGPATEPIKVRTDRAKILKETRSLNQTLRRAANAGADTNGSVLGFGPSVSPQRGSIFDAPNNPGMMIDLHLSEGRNMHADPMRELRDSHIPTLDPIARFVVKGHARDSTNRLEGARHGLEGLALGRRWQGQGLRRRHRHII